MSSPPPNPDSRDLPYGWIQQYNWDYKQWFYVNTREQPPRSSWEHPLGPIPQGFAPPQGPPPPDRSYNPPAQQGYGGYPGGYQPSYGQPPPQGYYNGPQGGYGGPPQSDNRGYYPSQQQQVGYTQDQRRQKKGPGMGTALLAGGAGLVGGALLMDAIEDHNEREREEGYDQGYQEGYDDGGGFDGGW